ncbi:MAG: hypothetical protein H0W69_07020 [Gemmatimonadaceae bacterium]|nr:hypothetical protein [Gemmatimonadaceae bacterium]
MRTLRRILAQYGTIAVVVYLALHMIVLFAFYLAIKMGWTPSGVAGEAGIWTVAYLLTKLTQPIRLGLTLLLTPLLARLVSRPVRSVDAGKA